MSLSPYWSDNQVQLFLGDCLEVLAGMDAASVDAIVTDPPYGLEFMSVAWDTFSERPKGESRIRNEWGDFGSREHARHPSEVAAIWRRKALAYYEFSLAWAEQAFRVLKPGGHCLAFGATRNWHRLTCAIEDAGFEVRDSIHWIYGSGFPKSLDVSKAIDKAAGAEREVVSEGQPFGRGSMRNRSRVEMGYRPTEVNPGGGVAQITAPATDDAARWDGWGTALKPAHEPIVVARKPLAGTVAQNVLEHGTGALNIVGCRVGDDTARSDRYNGKSSMPNGYGGRSTGAEKPREQPWDAPAGRWPPNVVLGTEAAAELDRQSGVLTSALRGKGYATPATNQVYSSLGTSPASPANTYGDSGGASRFFPVFRYEAKAASSERPRGENGVAHPTVKPADLMAWLVRLVTPPGGLVLDPFAGSGTTAEACIVEGFRCVLIEQDPAYAELIRTRLRKDIQPAMFGEATA